MLRFVLLLLFAFASLPLSAVSIVDGKGQRYDFPTPLRVVSLAPSVTDLIFEIGAQKHLIGVSAFSNTRDKDIACIGSIYGIDWEKLVLLKPDVAILPFVQDNSIASRLAQCGIKCIYLHKESVEGIAKDLLLLGEIFGRQSQSRALADKFKHQLSNPNKSKKIRSLFLFSYVVAGKGSFVSDILQLCGFENCADKTNATWPILSREFILNENPDVLFVVCSSPQQQKNELERLRSDVAWASTNAVKNNRIYFVKYDDVILPSVRVLNVIDFLREVRKDFQ